MAIVQSETDIVHDTLPTASESGPTASEAGKEFLGQFIPLHYHFQMLQDRQRLSGFRRAIELHVEPGMHVVELGGGTGVLSSFAARCGAFVTCVERNPQLVQFANHAIRANGLADRIEVVLADAAEYAPNRPVDAVICEMLHVGLVREKQTSVISSFKENYTRRWGDALPRFIPEATRLMIQLIEHPFDFDGYYAPLPIFQSPDPTANDGLKELSSLVDYQHIFYDEPIPPGVDWLGDLQVHTEGFASALRFVTQNFLSVETDSDSPVWPNQFLIVPLKDPSVVVKGQTVRTRLAYQYGDTLEQMQESIGVEYSDLR